MEIIYKKGQTLYKPGQILHISSSSGTWYNIGLFRNIIPVKNLSDTYDFYTYCNLYIEANKSSLTFERGNYTNLDTSFEVVREATDEERTQLFDALVKAFKEYDLNWANHFTDSIFYDIRDWLCWSFDVDINLLPNDSILPTTIYEITKYIWDALCKETGNYQENTVAPEMVNKQEFIAKVKRWLELETNWNKEYIRDEVAFCDWCRDIRNPNYGKIDELVKYLEK
jgi:hypothetical protein